MYSFPIEGPVLIELKDRLPPKRMEPFVICAKDGRAAAKRSTNKISTVFLINMVSFKTGTQKEIMHQLHQLTIIYINQIISLPK